MERGLEADDLPTKPFNDSMIYCEIQTLDIIPEFPDHPFALQPTVSLKFGATELQNQDFQFLLQLPFQKNPQRFKLRFFSVNEGIHT